MAPKKAKTKDIFFDPSCCSYKLGGDIREHVDRLTSSENVDPDVKAILNSLMEEDEANKNTLVYNSLVRLHKYIQRADPEYSEPFYLFSQSCKCIEPKPRENKQLDERLKVLRLKTSHTIYNNMTAAVDRAVEDKMIKTADSSDRTADLKSSSIYSTNSNNNINNTGIDNQSIVSEFKRLNGSMVAVFNSFLVFICTFIFCYKALEYALPRPNYIAQVLFGMGGSTIVAIAELYFLLRVV